MSRQMIWRAVELLVLAGTLLTCHISAEDLPEWHPKPGDHFPYDFSTPVLGGSNFTLNNETVKAGPIIVYAYDPTDAYSRYMWSSDDSVQNFLTSTPSTTRYLFLSYGDRPMQDAQYFRTRIRDSLTALNVTENNLDKRMQQFNFGTMNLASVSDVGANFLPYLLDHWKSPRRKLIANGTDGWTMTTTRLSADFDWLPYSPPLTFTPLANLGNGCSDLEPFSLTGKVAFVLQEDGPDSNKGCSYTTLIQKAQAANASAIIVSAVPGRDVTKMQCTTIKECEIPLNISAVQIPYTAAVEIRDALARGPVTVNYTAPDGGGFWAAINEEGKLEQVGWEKWPTLMHLAWAAQWYDYMTELRANLTKPALVVPVFNNQPMAGENGLVGNITLPTKEELADYDTFEIDFSLGCDGPLDKNCPYWDHTVQLYVCCSNPEGPQKPCEKCGPTVWGSIESNHRPSDPTESEWRETRGPSFLQRGSHSRPECGRELGRWITPFRRRVGRWITDVTPLWPLLAGQHCTFRAQDPPWVEPWLPSLNLRFLKSNDSDGLKPFSLQMLPYNGGTFDKTYNTKEINPPFEFPTPEGTDKALLVATITGHGSDENNCAEFCPTSHHFVVNGKEHLVNYTEAGTNWGCADKVREGSVPNESGTWHYGRNGWCDGQNIRPWLADITRDLKPPGQGNNTIEYKGLFRDVSPDPKSNPGSIIMQSNVAFYGKTSAKPASGGEGGSLSGGEGGTALGGRESGVSGGEGGAVSGGEGGALSGGDGEGGPKSGTGAEGCHTGKEGVCAAGSLKVGGGVDGSLTGTIVQGLANVRLVLEQPQS